MEETVSIRTVYDELKKIEKKMATKEEVEMLIETIEIMSNPKTMRQIADSMDDIQCGRVKETASVRDMLNELWICLFGQ